MSAQCLQALNNGEQCNAPAVNGSKFCRHHDPQRPPRETQNKSRDEEPLVLPLLLDKPSILAALNEVVQALSDHRVKRSTAGTLLSAIKFAARLVTEISESGQTVIPAGIIASNRYQQPAARNSAAPMRPGQVVSHLAASRDPRLNPSSQDSFIQQLVAQSHNLPASSSKPDSRFTRA